MIAPAVLLVDNAMALLDLDLVEKASLTAVCVTLSGVVPSMKLAPHNALISVVAPGNWSVKGLIKVNAAFVQLVQAKLDALETRFWKSPTRVLTSRSLTESFPTMSSRLFRVSVTQSWFEESSFKHITLRTVG